MHDIQLGEQSCLRIANSRSPLVALLGRARIDRKRLSRTEHLEPELLLRLVGGAEYDLEVHELNVALVRPFLLCPAGARRPLLPVRRAV